MLGSVDRDTRWRITEKPRHDGHCRPLGTANARSSGTWIYLATTGPVAASGSRTGSASPTAAPFAFAERVPALIGADLPARSPLRLLDKMKSEMRGAISARKRDPL